MHRGSGAVLAGNVLPGASSGKDIRDAIEETTLFSARSPDWRFRRRKKRLNDLPQRIIRFVKTREGPDGPART